MTLRFCVDANATRVRYRPMIFLLSVLKVILSGKAQCDARGKRFFQCFCVRFVMCKEPDMATATQSKARGSNASDNGGRQRPVWTQTGFPLTIAAFEFPTENGPPNFSVKLTRSFKRDEDSEWENTEYLGGGDLLRAAKLFEAADSFVQSRLKVFHRSRKENEQS